MAKKPKYVLDADIEKCFDKISHEKLLAKLNTIPVIANLVKGWLKAGIFDQGNWHEPEAGVPQGGVISPLLMNVAMHGFETAIGESLPLCCTTSGFNPTPEPYHSGMATVLSDSG